MEYCHWSLQRQVRDSREPACAKQGDESRACQTLGGYVPGNNEWNLSTTAQLTSQARNQAVRLLFRKAAHWTPLHLCPNSLMRFARRPRRGLMRTSLVRWKSKPNQRPVWSIYERLWFWLVHSGSSLRTQRNVWSDTWLGHYPYKPSLCADFHVIGWEVWPIMWQSQQQPGGVQEHTRSPTAKVQFQGLMRNPSEPGVSFPAWQSICLVTDVLCIIKVIWGLAIPSSRRIVYTPLRTVVFPGRMSMYDMTV